MTIPWRRVFRMSLRGLMVVILIVGVLLGWRVNRANTQRRAVAVIQKAAGSVEYDYQYPKGSSTANAKPWAPDWLRRAVGDEYFQEVTSVRFNARHNIDGQTMVVTDETMAAIGRLDRLITLDLPRTTVTDDSLAHISGLTGLNRLLLDYCPEVTDRGLAHLRRLNRLRVVRLSSTRITDAGIDALSGNSDIIALNLDKTKLTDVGLARINTLWGKSLKSLSVTRCPGVTDTGMAHIREMGQLQVLFMYDTSVTDTGLAQLSGLTDLIILATGGSRVTDAGLAHLHDLGRLQILSISESPVTDAGLDYLRGLKNLRELALGHTNVSDEGLAALRVELPSLRKVSNQKRSAPSVTNAKPK